MYPGIKRFFDMIISLALLIVLVIPLLVLMVCVRIDSPGSPVFAQTRIGKKGKSFTIYKLRTMRKDAPRSVATSALSNAQSHITRLGAFLRKSSLDELPQLWNIFRGDMSLVGPRPLVPEEEDVHAERLEKNVYDVRPGITGWAQINGRDKVNAGMKADLDAYYVRHCSFLLDMRILLKTVACVLTSQGIKEGKQEEETDA